MKRHLLIPALMLGAALLAQSASAQFRPNQRYWSVGGSIGTALYAGDLTNADKTGIPFTQIETLQNPGVLISGHATYHLSQNWAVRGSLSYLLIRGSDHNSTNTANQRRNLSFENGLFEASAVLQWDFLGARRNYRLRRMFTPYLFGGIAAAYSDPRARIQVVNGSVVNSVGIGPQDFGWQKLRPLRTEGQETAYSPIVIAVPFGAGVRYKLNDRIDIGLEVNIRYTFSDYLDDVSGESAINTADNRQTDWYPFPSRLITDGGAVDPLRVAASNRSINTGNFPAAWNDRRGSSKFKDWYASVGLTVNYILDSSPGGIRCPKPGKGRKKGFLGIF